MQAYLKGRRKDPISVPAQTVHEASELEPVLEYLLEIRDLSLGVHRRLDNIVEKLIDLDQRSELIWEQVREWAKGRPNSERDFAVNRLEALLSGVWSELQPDSQADLADAMIVATEARRVAGVWRCAVIG